MSNYTIWNEITREAPSDNAPSARFGARAGFDQTILVGTSAKNSHALAIIGVRRHETANGTVTFSLHLDSKVIKRAHLVGDELQIYDID